MTDDITVVSTGDLYLNRDNPETAFDALDSQLVTADLRIGNLEAVITDTGSPLGSPPHIRSPLNTIEALTRFDILSFANNHAMDFGPEALTDTIDTLTAEGISVVGAGVTKTASETPSIIDTRGGRVGCVAFEATRISSGFLMQASENRPGMNTVSVVPSTRNHT